MIFVIFLLWVCSMIYIVDWTTGEYFPLYWKNNNSQQNEDYYQLSLSSDKLFSNELQLYKYIVTGYSNPCAGPSTLTKEQDTDKGMFQFSL